MSESISIEGLSKAAVLAALYNRARPLGLGFLHYKPQDMTEAEAQEILASGQTSFDYLQGRVMKVNLVGNEFWPGAYDCDNGIDAAKYVIDQLRQQPAEAA